MHTHVRTCLKETLFSFIVSARVPCGRNRGGKEPLPEGFFCRMHTSSLKAGTSTSAVEDSFNSMYREREDKLALRLVQKIIGETFSNIGYIAWWP